MFTSRQTVVMMVSCKGKLCNAVLQDCRLPAMLNKTGKAERIQGTVANADDHGKAGYGVRVWRFPIWF
jgi:hypothetical protein